MWHFIASIDVIPKDRELIVAVIDRDGLHELEFPCRCSSDGCWLDIASGRLIDVRPTHWREVVVRSNAPVPQNPHEE